MLYIDNPRRPELLSAQEVLLDAEHKSHNILTIFFHITEILPNHSASLNDH
jgi:hypothetical protein